MPYEEQFAALSHPLRQKILDALQEAPRSVGDLTQQFDSSQPVISQHLKVLRAAGLVDVSAQGARRIYRIEDRQMQALRRFLEAHWRTSLGKVGRPFDA